MKVTCTKKTSGHSSAQLFPEKQFFSIPDFIEIYSKYYAMQTLGSNFDEPVLLDGCVEVIRPCLHSEPSVSNALHSSIYLYCRLSVCVLNTIIEQVIIYKHPNTFQENISFQTTCPCAYIDHYASFRAKLKQLNRAVSKLA